MVSDATGQSHARTLCAAAAFHANSTPRQTVMKYLVGANNTRVCATERISETQTVVSESFARVHRLPARRAPNQTAR